MKRPVLISAVIAGLLVLVWAFAQAPSNTTAGLARLFPSGPLLYLEARDFGALLAAWNGSDEKRLWLAGDNFQVFSRSRLYLKLQQAQTEFAAAAGVPADLDLLANAAGGQSAIAIYDIGSLEFLYITRLSSDRFAGGALWKTRGNYQPRQSAGIDYYVRTDPGTRRVAAFSAAKDYVLLATREDLIAGALSLLAGVSGPSVAGEAWFDKTVREAKAPGELRLVMNVEELTKSPHFRSYWIQRNITELRQYEAAISDAVRASGEWRENRVLIRGAEVSPTWNEPAVSEVLRLAPATAGVYRAWASPSSEDAFKLLYHLLDPRPASAAPSDKAAPVVALSDGTTGSEADLETRIDEPALETGVPTAAELQVLLGTKRLEAMLAVGSSRAQPDGVFVGVQAGVALLAASDWDAAAARNAVASAVAELVSTDQLGVRWLERRAGVNSYYSLDGLAPLAIAVNGRLLVIANRSELLESMLAGLAGQPVIPGAKYAAAYRHSAELLNFRRMSRLLDTPLAKETPQDGPQPAFFSGDIASLGQALSSVASESITVHDTGTVVTENVVYRMK
jgi:hypothetical protein